MKERRKFGRFKAALDAEYTKVEGYAIINSLSSTKNISLGGLCTRLSKIVKKRSMLLIELSSHYNKKLAVLAKVVWAKPAGNKKGNICGVEFLWISSMPLLNNCIEFAKEISSSAA